MIVIIILILRQTSEFTVAAIIWSLSIFMQAAVQVYADAVKIIIIIISSFSFS